MLHIYWDSGISLSAPDVFEISRETEDTASWSINYIHKMLTSLMDNGLLEICDFTRSGKRYVRKFHPCMTKEEYYAELLESQGVDTTAFAKIAMALVKKQEKKKSDDAQNSKLIAELEQMIDEFEKTKNKDG